MSKEELLKIQTCTLKIDIHCVGCKRKVRKILQKIQGVYKVSVDSEQGKVTVLGNVDPLTLIKKLEKCGKPAQIWGVQKEIQPMNKQTVDNKNQVQKEDGENNNEQQKGGPTPQQLQKLQQLKGFQDLKLPPQFKDMKLPSVDGGGDEKGRQNKVPEIDESDDEFDDDDYEEEEEEEEEDDDIPMKKPVTCGGGGSQMGNMVMNSQLMKGGQLIEEIGNNGKNGQNKSSNINVNGMPNMSGGMGHGTPGPQRFQPMMNQQQQLMNQQRANDNERFQPMMYARPLPDANYMQPPPYPYPYPYPQGDPLTHLFSDDNTSSCNLM